MKKRRMESARQAFEAGRAGFAQAVQATRQWEEGARKTQEAAEVVVAANLAVLRDCRRLLKAGSLDVLDKFLGYMIRESEQALVTIAKKAAR